MNFDFDRLVDKICDGQVVPLIGNELCYLKNTQTGEEISIEDFLAKEVAKVIRYPYKNEKLSEIARIATLEEDIYVILRTIYQKIGMPDKEYAMYTFQDKNFERIAEIRGFQTYLSVSFTDILQKKLIEKWGADNVEVIDFSLSPVSGSVIGPLETSGKKIVVINLLGSILGRNEFAVTEEEYLEYLFNILSGSRGLISANDSLASRIKDNAFIYLGCSYPTWYTRYIVRGITQRRYTNHKIFNNFFVDVPPMDPIDKVFFKSYNSLILDDQKEIPEVHQDATSAMDPAPQAANSRALADKFIKKLHENIIEKQKPSPKFAGKVFISYYFVNSALSQQIDKGLRAEGIECWLDTRELHAGEHRPEIEDKIRECKVFFALISSELLDKINITPGSEQANPYSVRVEWANSLDRYGSEVYLYKHPRFKIIPCIVGDVSQNDNRIPEIFRAQRIYSYAEKDALISDIKKLSANIRKLMKNLIEEPAVISEQDNTEHLSPEYLAQNPYPGLNSYDEERQEYFMGRDKEKQDVLQTLDLHSLCFLIGKSGLGKSSLINAGLIPELKQTGHAPIRIRINFDDETNLTTQVKNIIGEKIKTIDPTAIAFNGLLLWEYFQLVKIFNGYLKPVLIFDQFEEIFTRGQNRQVEVNSLMAEIIDLAENRIPEKVQQVYVVNKQTVPSNLKKDYKILFALREDYLPQLTSLKNYIPTLKFSIYRLTQMTGPDAFKAVFFPAQKASPPLLDEGTAREIIAKLPESIDDELNIINDEGQKSDDPFANKRIEPFLLNLFCFTLNEERKDKRLPAITKNDVANTDFKKLVEDYYNKVTGRSWRLSAAIENELVTPDGKYRKFASKDDFINGGKLFNMGAKLSDRDVQYLIDKKIIRRKRIGVVDYFELIHDSLISKVIKKRRLRTIAIRVAVWAISVLFVGLIFVVVNTVELHAQRQLSDEKIAQANLRAEIEKRQAYAQEQIAKAYAQEQIAKAQAQGQIANANAKAQEQIANADAQEQIANAKAQEQIAKADAQEKIANAKAAEKIELNNSKNALSSRRQLDSLKSLTAALAYADTSLKVNTPASKQKFAVLAYDSLPKTLRANDVFIPKVYMALSAFYQNSLKENRLYAKQRRRGYKNIDAIFNITDKLYFNRPFVSVSDFSRDTLISNPNLLRSWVSPNGAILVALLVNRNETKQLIVRKITRDFGSAKDIRIASLPGGQDVLSLIFDIRNNTCIYATRFPTAVYSLNLTTLAAPVLIKNVQNNEYIFLANRGGYFSGISNLGNYLLWAGYAPGEPQSTKPHVTNGDVVTAVACGDLNHKTLFAGCENGNIYKIDAANNIVKFYSPPYKSAVITCLSSSLDGKWLAAGFFDGTIKLWRLGPNDDAVPADIDLGNYQHDGVSAIAFSSRDNILNLIVSTDYGYVYHFPLSMSALYKLFPKK